LRSCEVCECELLLDIDDSLELITYQIWSLSVPIRPLQSNHFKPLQILLPSTRANVPIEPTCCVAASASWSRINVCFRLEERVWPLQILLPSTRANVPIEPTCCVAASASWSRINVCFRLEQRVWAYEFRRRTLSRLARPDSYFRSLSLTPHAIKSAITAIARRMSACPARWRSGSYAANGSKLSSDESDESDEAVEAGPSY
jgi:hypothetical protein